MESHKSNGSNKFNVLRELQVLRTERIGNQTEAAKLLGVSKNTLSAWETGKLTPNGSNRDAFAMYLGEHLALKADPDRFGYFWENIPVNEWQWSPISEEEKERWLSTPKTKLRESATAGKLKTKLRSSYAYIPTWIFIGIGAVIVVTAFLLGRNGRTAASENTPEITLEITNANVNGRTIEVMPRLDVGSKIYSDRSLIFSDIPEKFIGAHYLVNANDDKWKGYEEEVYLLSFSVNKPVTVCIGHDPRFQVIPEWLEKFEMDSTDQLFFTHPEEGWTHSLGILCQEYKSGKIELGPNMTPQTVDKGNRTMYTVVVLD